MSEHAPGTAQRARQFGEPAPDCLSCGTVLDQQFLDLGMAPPCEEVVHPADIDRGATFYPLRAWVCHTCWLVQIEDVVPAEAIFNESYPYVSSISESWLDHARAFVDQIVDREELDEHSTVVEVGSNDGYLLQFVAEKGIACHGVDPSANVAALAVDKGIPTTVAFFGRAVAEDLIEQGLQADLVCGANVMAQVPDPNDFVAGLATLVAPTGLVTIEYPHLATLLEHVEFDTIYHEHYTYFSLGSTIRLFERHGLRVTDVEELATHGGSLRVHARPAAGNPEVSEVVDQVLRRENEEHALQDPQTYERFGQQVARLRTELVEYLQDQVAAGRTVVGYGAPGKGNTLLNYCGIRSDLLRYTVDRNPAKQGTYLPGSLIPVFAPERLEATKPDVILILPWNLEREITAQLAYTADWGAELVVAVPSVRPASADEDLAPWARRTPRTGR